MSKKELCFGDIEVTVTKGIDGKVVVYVDTPELQDLTELGSPDIRVWINDSLIYADGETGDDLEIDLSEYL